MWLQLSKSTTLALAMTQAAILRGWKSRGIDFVSFGQINFRNPLLTENGVKEIHVSGTLGDGSRFESYCKMQRGGAWIPVSAFVNIMGPHWNETIGVSRFTFDNVGGMEKLVADYR